MEVSFEPNSPWKYHVFLSFRGSDTRNNFTDHLYNALWRMGIIAFRDDEELEKGNDIKKELLQAIDESLIAIVILSPNYASSSWCLDELQKILESKKVLDRKVIPVFYGIEPSCVRYQTESFAEAFQKHQQRYGLNKMKIQRWRDALSEVASLSGWDSKDRLETELIEEIIRQLWSKLKPNLPLYTNDGLVGIDRRIRDLYQILEIGSTDIRFVGIWGMGGLGKTTLALLLFNQTRYHFDISYCLENVREKSNQVDGLVCLQKQLLSHLDSINFKIDNLEDGKATIRNLLCHKRVFLVLDDVDDIKQLENLAGMLNWFGKGSRVIVTTRDIHLLASHEALFKYYKLDALTTNESVELFRLKAFKRNCPEKVYLEFSQILVQYASGLPLALKVLGGHLCGRDVSMWKDAIDSFRQNPPKEILDTLRISYDRLEDGVKNIFLDIACFFRGWHEDRVRQILENCGFHHKYGIQILIERSLLECHKGTFWMHDLLQEMGKKIVIQRSGNEISKQSRLWSISDVDEVLEENKGTEFVEGLVLEAHNDEACWDPEAFLKMSKLRMLIILHGFPLSLGLKCLSNSIKVLEWNGYPLKSLPDSVKLRKLVELNMRGSKIRQLWNGTRDFRSLKLIDLRFSEDLIETPNFVGVPNLESLILEGCSNLVEIHQSAGQLKKLVVLSLKDCVNLKGLPTKLETNSLKDFILYGCSTLEKLPEFGENMEGITMLDLRGCNSLICLPNSICNLQSLKIINISGCSALEKFPEFGETMALEMLDLSGCRGLGSNSRYKSNLLRPITLTVTSLSGLTMLRQLDASFCNLSDGSIPDDLSCLSSLERINLSGNKFANLPSTCISNLPRLINLVLNFCPNLRLLPVFPPSLRKVSAINSGPMEALPDVEIWKLFKFDDGRLRKSLQSCKIDTREYIMYIPASEIPPWFDNLMVYDDKRADWRSIIIDIPYCCRSKKRWGIAVCFLYKPFLSVQPGDMVAPLDLYELCCCFKALKSNLFPDKTRRRWYKIGDKNMSLNSSHQFVILFNGNDYDIQEVLREGHEQIEMLFIIPATMLYNPVNPLGHCGLKIIKCAWRVICEDEVWQKANIDVEGMFSISNQTTSRKKARITEMEEEATATETPFASNECAF